MGCVGNALFGIPIAVSGAALIFLFYIIFGRTKQVTEFLAVTNWFGYSKISQKIRFNSIVVEKTRAAYKNKPILEMVREFGRLFREDFEKLFPKLQPGVKYRVVTHYSDVIQKAVAEHKIVLIGEPKEMTTRFLKEIRPLVGWRDYRIIKRCYRKEPNIDRCCENCDKYEKCLCRKGEVCKRMATKIFYEFNFVLADKPEK